jgi:uncharacterized protein
VIVYLHGFGSIGASPKVDALKQVFGADKVLAPNLPMDPVEVKNIIHEIVKEYSEARADAPEGAEIHNERLIFVGTSLGGFYANYFGQRYNCPAVVVNPSTNPSVKLRDRLGPNKNFQTNEEFLVTIAHLDELAKMREEIKKTYKAKLVSVFAAKDDEVVPYESVLEAYPFNAFECVTETGGHRFTDHWDLVISRIKALADGD